MAEFIPSVSAPLNFAYQLALCKAFEWHCFSPQGFQMRKDGSPYLAHLLSVSALVLENGGTEEEAIAALLHDAVEDARVSVDLIETHFGKSVADIVLELSEPKQENWRDRKLAYIKQIREGSRSAVLISLADKTHNALAYLKGAKSGAKDGSQSNPEQTLWFLGELEAVYRDRLPDCYLVKVFTKTLNELAVIWRKPDPTYHYYPDNFSRPYWMELNQSSKHYWIEKPSQNGGYLSKDQEVTIIEGSGVLGHYEPGQLLVTFVGSWEGMDVVAEVWGESGQWSLLPLNQGTILKVDILRNTEVRGVTVLSAQLCK